MVILSGRKTPKKTKNSKADRKDGTKNKAKSLPGTLKQEKSKSEKNLHSENLAHHSSTNSLSSGQVWQRHYKSKPQSPGLLTMIPPSSKEIVKLKNASSRKSALKPSQAEVPKASTVIRRIQEYVQNDTKVLILMRGAPGSGKTCMARNVVLSVTNSELSQHILSTDDYFVLLGRGNYAFDSSQLPQAHNWNQKRVSESLKRGINPIVVDNTNTQAWEMRPYVVMAAEHGYLVEVLEPETSWRNKEAELAKRNIHSIPREKIRQMLERYEPGWTGEKLLKLYVLKQSDVTPTPQDVKRSTNPLLEQHRQQDVINIPEKPKRKRNGSKKKIRNNVAGINITEDREKQLEELSKLFAEYGKTMDPVSKQKVLESGVPISEVVSRMRKLQGNILPLPKQTSSNVLETEFNQSCNLVKPVPDYSTPLRDSCSESYDLGAISSSNASEASESETETDTDTDLLKWKETEEYFECETQISFKDGEDITEYKNDDRKSNQVAKKFSSQEEAYLIDFNASGIQSSENHEETLLIDLETTLTPASVSQEDLSILNFNGSDNINSKDSSSSTEEQETQMLSLQESLRDVFIDSTRKSQETSLESSPEKKPNAANNSEKIAAKPFEIELSDSLMNVLSKRFEISESNDRAKESDVAEGGVSINESLLQMLVKKYSADEVENSEIKETNSNTESHIIDNEVSKKSPDLEEVPLPSIPPDKNENESPKFQCLESEIANNSKSVELSADRPVLKRDNFEDIVNSWNCSIAEESKKDTSPKPARTKNSLLGAKKKTGANTRDKSPDELLRSVDLSWSSVPFTSSWEDVSDKPLESEFQSLPKPQRRFVLKSDSSTNTLHGDFDLWKKEVDGIVKLTAHSRNINQNYRESEIPVSHVSDILMLDKSSMTLDAEEMDSMGREIALETLTGMFPDISKHHLIEILDKCKGNLIWAIEVLLETPQNLANLPDAALIEESPVSCQGAKAIEEPDYVSLQNAMISDGKKTIKRKKEKKSAPSELSLILKKQIEDGIQINEDFYQDRTLFLKKLRHGEIEFGDGPLEPVPEIPAENTVQSYECEEDIEEEETIPMKLDPDFFRILNQQFGSLDGSGKEKEIGELYKKKFL